MNSDLLLLKKKLEKEGMEKVKQIFEEGKKNNKNKLQIIKEKEDAFVAVMKEGEKEFLEKTGRFMTYSEIREMYG